MTTPERLRRRQYLEGVGMVFLGLTVVVSTIVGDRRDDQQDTARATVEDSFRSCIIDQVKAIGTSFDARSTLNAQDTKATNKVITDIATAADRGDSFAIPVALAQFKLDQAAIKKARAKEKVPDFPDGKCDS